MKVSAHLHFYVLYGKLWLGLGLELWLWLGPMADLGGDASLPPA